MKRIILLVIVAAVMAACSGRAGTAAQPTPTPEVVYADSTDEPVVDEGTGFIPSDTVTIPKTFAKLDKRGWAKVVKAPDSYRGKGFKLVACIYQFDAATGTGGFLAQASFRKEPYWWTSGQNAAFSGDAKKLAPFVQGDIVSMNVASLGSFSYDTQAGGNTTVPAFQVWTIKKERGSCE